MRILKIIIMFCIIVPIWLGTIMFDAPIKWETTIGVCEHVYHYQSKKVLDYGIFGMQRYVQQTKEYWLVTIYVEKFDLILLEKIYIPVKEGDNIEIKYGKSLFYRKLMVRIIKTK